jgi:hypothetical protein
LWKRKIVPKEQTVPTRPTFVVTRPSDSNKRIFGACVSALTGLVMVGISIGQENQWQVTQLSNPLPDTSPGLLEPRIAAASSTVPSVGGYQGTLPNKHGQVWREYDIRAYTERETGAAKPEQAIVDWILRETGTEVWFSEPLGILSANSSKLRVYHTPGIQRVVASIVERFVHSDAGSYDFSIRMVTVQSPNWRSWAYHRLESVPAQTPGVEAWLVSKEDAAVLIAKLRKRPDFREHSSPNVLVPNARSHEIARMHPVAYVQSITSRSEVFGTTLRRPAMGQVEQGFKLRISPLLAADERTADAVLKVETRQVEKLTSIAVNLPTGGGPRTASIQVPQTSSWRLHERFRWPVDRVLLISCGVVAAPVPERPAGQGFLGGLFSRAPRVEALLFLEAKGKSAGTIATPNTSRSAGLYQGRY